MTVENIWYDDLIRRALNVQKFGKDHDYEYDLKDPSFRMLHECAVVSSEAFFDVDKENYKETVWLDAKVIGDASETALVKFF
jgi:sodium/potassium-transporting ATPase subunit alpha